MADKRDVCKCGMATIKAIQHIDDLGMVIEERNMVGVFPAINGVGYYLTEVEKNCKIGMKDINKELADIRESVEHKEWSRATIMCAGLERGLYRKLSECAGD